MKNSVTELPFNSFLGIEAASEQAQLLRLPAGAQYLNHLGTECTVVDWRNQKLIRNGSIGTGNSNLKSADIQDAEIVDLDEPAEQVSVATKTAGHRPVGTELLVRKTEIDTKYHQAELVEDLTWDMLSEIKGIGPKSIEKIKSFVEQQDPFGLETMKNTFVYLRDLIVSGNEFGIPVPTHVSSTIPKSGVHQGVVWMGIPFKKNYQDYIENQRSRYGKEEAEIIAEMKRKTPGTEHLVKSCVVQCKDDYEDDVYCRWNRFTFPHFERMLESLATDGSQVLIVRGKKLEDFGVSIHVKDAWVLDLSED